MKVLFRRKLTGLKYAHYFLVVAALLLLISGQLMAQAAFSTIRGTVKDQSDALVPGVEVVVTEIATNVSRTAVSGETGDFEVPQLKPGVYRLTAELPGFKTYEVGNINLESGQARRLDVILQVGETSEVVMVEGGTEVITTDSGTLSGAITKLQFKEQPFASSEAPYPGVTDMLSTLPGVQGAGWNVTIAGQEDVTIQDDGVQNDRSGNQSVNINTYEEVRVVTVNNTADQARAASFNTTTKRGSNDIHGMAYYRHTNSALGARDFFEPEKTSYKFHDFYGEVGGRIIRDRLFFYAGWTHIEVPAGSYNLADVPTELMRQGDFSEFSDPVINPFTGEAFSDNRIPANLINDTAKKMQDLYYPSPNGPGFTNNFGFFFPYPEDYFKADYPTFRVDAQLSEQNSIFFRWMYYYSPYVLNSTNLPGFERTRVRFHDKGVVSDTHVFSPAVINTFRFGFNGNFIEDGEEVDGVKPPNGNEAVAAIGLQGVNPSGLSAAGFPRTDISGLTALRAREGGRPADEYDFSFEDSLTYARGRHVFKFGFQYNDFNDFSSVVTEGTYGRFNFDGQFSGNAYADFLLGIPSRSRRLDPRLNRTRRAGELGIYFTDSFKINPQFTLDYGLRWDYFSSPTYDDNLMFNWDPRNGDVVIASGTSSEVSPLYPGTINIVEGNTVPTADKSNIHPRIGLAYRIGEDLVIRGGWGTYSERISEFNRLHSGGPFEITESYSENDIVNGQPLFAFPNPFPGDLGQAAIPSQSVTGHPLKTENGRIHQFNLSVEKQMFDLGFRVSYIGSRSVGLNYYLNVNQPEPSDIPFTSDRRNYPQFVSASWPSADGKSNYDSVQFEVKKRAGAFTFDAHYTLSSNLHNYLRRDNPYNVTTQWSRDDFNQRHRAVISLMWELPFGHGRRYGADVSGAVNQVIGGWRVQTISYFATGTYFSPSFSGSDPSNTNSFGGLPDRVCDGSISNPSVDLWFDASCFAVPPDDAARFGNSGINILRGPGINVHHLSLVKQWRLTERFQMALNVGFTNLFNHPHFSTPRNNITSSDPGVITSTPGWNPEKTLSRRVQGQLRLEW